MANPQKENGHVEIANEIIEELARVNLSAYEWRVLMIVLRKTYGWQKKTDRISLSQIAKATGIQRPHVVRAKKTLIDKKLLIERQGEIGPNKNYEQWQSPGYPGTDLGTGGGTDSGTTQVVPIQATSGTDSGTKSGTDSGTHKRKKDTIQKKERADRKFTPPTIEQVRVYAESRGYPDFDAERFVEYYATAEWHDSKGNPVRNWKQKLLSVWLTGKYDDAPSAKPLERDANGLTPREALLK